MVPGTMPRSDDFHLKARRADVSLVHRLASEMLFAVDRQDEDEGVVMGLANPEGVPVDSPEGVFGFAFGFGLAAAELPDRKSARHSLGVAWLARARPAPVDAFDRISRLARREVAQQPVEQEDIASGAIDTVGIEERAEVAEFGTSRLAIIIIAFGGGPPCGIIGLDRDVVFPLFAFALGTSARDPFGKRDFVHAAEP